MIKQLFSNLINLLCIYQKVSKLQKQIYLVFYFLQKKNEIIYYIR